MENHDLVSLLGRLAACALGALFCSHPVWSVGPSAAKATTVVQFGTRTQNDGTGGGDGVTFIEEAPDGTIYVVGAAEGRSSDTGGTPSNPFLAQFDESGAFLGQRIFDARGMEIKALRVSADGIRMLMWLPGYNAKHTSRQPGLELWHLPELESEPTILYQHTVESPGWLQHAYSDTGGFGVWLSISRGTEKIHLGLRLDPHGRALSQQTIPAAENYIVFADEQGALAYRLFGEPIQSSLTYIDNAGAWPPVGCGVVRLLPIPWRPANRRRDRVMGQG